MFYHFFNTKGMQYHTENWTFDQIEIQYSGPKLTWIKLQNNKMILENTS